MGDDDILSQAEKVLKSVGTTLEQVGAWLKGIGLSLVGGGSTTTQPTSVTGAKGKEKPKTEEQLKAEEQAKAEEKAKAEEQLKAEEKAKATEKAKAEADKLKQQAEGDLAALQKVVESIVEATLRQPSSDSLAKLNIGLEAALKLDQPEEQSTVLSSLAKEIATVRNGAEQAAKDSAALVATRERASKLKLQAETALVEVEKVVEAIAESTLKVPEAQKLEELKKRQSTTASQIDPGLQEKEFTTIVADIGKFKGEADTAKAKSDEIQATRERVSKLKLQAETALVEVEKVVEAIAESTLKAPEAQKVEELKKRQSATASQSVPGTQEKEFTTLVADIGKFKGEADAAKKKSDEVQAVRKRVETLKTEVEKELTALQQVVDPIAEATLKQPSAEAMARLNTSLEAALKLATPEEQEVALTKLGKEITPVRLAADKAAKESAELVAARKRVAILKENVEKELAALELLINTSASKTLGGLFQALKERDIKAGALTDLTAQEKAFPILSKDIAILAGKTEGFIKEREEFLKGYAPIKADVDKAYVATSKNPRLPAAQAKVFKDMIAALPTQTYKQKTALLATFKNAADAINKIVEDGATFYSELAKIQTDYTNAKKEVGLKSLAPTAAMIAAFNDADARMEKAIQAVNWVNAEAALGELKTAIADVLEARVKRNSCDRAFQAIIADWRKANALIKGAGVPDVYASAFKLADDEMDADYRDRDWKSAEDKIPALKAEVDDVLNVAARGAAYYSEFQKIQAEFDAATNLINEDVVAPKSVADAFEKAKADLYGEVENESWGDAVTLVPAVKSAAKAVQLAKDELDKYNLAFDNFSGPYNKVKAAIGRGMIPATAAEKFQTADALVDEPYNARNWKEATTRLGPVKKACEAVEKIMTAGDAYFQAFAAIGPAFDRAVEVYGSPDEALTEALRKQFDDARSAAMTHAKNEAWDLALPAVTPLKTAVLAVNKADDERLAYFAKMGPVFARHEVANSAVEKAGMADPEGQAMIDATEVVAKAFAAKDWVLAESKVAPLVVAITAVEKVLKNPTVAAYHKEFAKIEADYDKAWSAVELNADKLDLLAKRFHDAQKVARDAAKKKDFIAATAALPTLKKVVDELIAAAQTFVAEKGEFKKKFKGLTGLADAQKIAQQPPKKLAGAEVKAFQDIYLPFNDARRAGDFTKAEAAITGLQSAITLLVNAHATYLSQNSSYEADLQKITSLAEAQELAAGGLSNPVITAKVTPFNVAKKAVDDAAAIEDWPAAQGKVSALKDAVGELLKAGKEADGAVSSGDVDKFKEKITKLEPRTKKADAGSEPAYLEALKTTVRQRLKEVTDCIGKAPTPDFAKAEIGHAKLLTELVAMEAAKTEYAEHRKKYQAALTGEVEKALKVALVPTKLATQRTVALEASEQRILKLVGSGKLAKADLEVAAWVNEAKAWQASKAAFDNLNKATEPDPVKLKALGGMPGGAKVLDALMAGLPEDKPQKFMKEAMTARFGFTVKQFAKKDPDRLENLPSKEINKELPDKSLKKMYELMAKLPTGNVKGPIKELIRFDEDKGGAAFTGGTKKIVWMYCGRANDPQGTKQQFNQPNSIVPKGEHVEPDFQAVDDKEVPYFDFATLHEVGHAVEAADASAVAPLLANAGWKTHKADEVAAVAAAHFGYDLDFVKTTLADKNSKPPADVTTVPTTSNASKWAKARDAVVDWCQSVRESNELWNKPGVSKQCAIGGRVYHEAYENDWVSYDVGARTKGISSYQFRSSGEWFAELYAAYFSKKLKKTHPYAPALKKLKKP